MNKELTKIKLRAKKPQCIKTNLYKKLQNFVHQKTSNTHVIDKTLVQEAVYRRYQCKHFKKDLYIKLI